MKVRSAKTSEESLQPPPNRRLVSLLSELAPRDGFLPSRLPDVSFMRTTWHIPRTPITYEPGIFIAVGVEGERISFALRQSLGSDKALRKLFRADAEMLERTLGLGATRSAQRFGIG